jgi:hypothetical protein
MGQCNYCTFEDLKKEVKRATNLKVTTVEDKGELGGVNVYVAPTSIVVEDLTPTAREQWFRHWYMELPNECVCDED